MLRLASFLLGLVVVAGCSDQPSEDGSAAPPSSSAPPSSPTPTSPPTSAPTSPPTQASEAPAPRLTPDDVRVATAVRAVQHLAGEIGSRPGHTRAYFRAAGWVEQQFESFGWDVERQRFPTPAGSYNGVEIEAGPSVNVIATRGDVEPGRPWLLVGAHLDTVPQGPGAEDNASGVGVVLALAEALERSRSRLPVVLVAFGSEEPRGPGEAHHYGSKAYVEQLTPAQRRSLQAMVSLDRVGVGRVVPVQTVLEANRVSRSLEDAAGRADVETVREEFETSSDHESFTDSGLPAARLGSTPYAQYHGEDDLPAVVDRAQLGRVARLMAVWLR